MAYYPLKVKDNSGNTHVVGDPRIADKADKVSPALTGTPTAPTATSGTNTTQVATTAFVRSELETLAAKASPALTGTPTAPTAAAGTNTTQVATTAFVRGEISSLVASSPAALDTLNELAAALGNDANFSTTVTNALALKANLASPTLTGTPSAPTAAVGTNTTQVATTAFVNNEIANDAVVKSLIDAKGDLVTATANDTPARLAVGFNGQVLVAASGESTGLIWQGPAEVIGIAVSDEETALTTGNAKVTFRMPFTMTLTDVRASLSTASTSGLPTFDINEGGSTILSTKLSIDANEKTSTTAATAAVISDSTLFNDAEITIDIDVAGTGAKGAKVYLIGRRA
jgi:hypothetical protein